MDFGYSRPDIEEVGFRLTAGLAVSSMRPAAPNGASEGEAHFPSGAAAVRSFGAPAADLFSRAPNRAANALESSPPSGSLRARDGSTLVWACEGAPKDKHSAAPRSLAIRVSPARPGHSVMLEHRIDGGPVTEQVAQPELRPSAPGERLFKAAIPPCAGGLLEFLPVLRFAGQPISSRLVETPTPPRFETKTEAARERENCSAPASLAAPIWEWKANFLGSLRATVRRQLVGKTPDGLRINWQIDPGRFSGPNIEAVVLAGSGDWMRVRPDGVALVDVRACLETTERARISAAYRGVLDLGPDGYDRALRGEFVPLPPLVVAPTFETGDPRWLWLNRAQCLGVGRVDTAALSYAFDIYVVEVGDRRRAG